MTCISQKLLYEPICQNILSLYTQKYLDLIKKIDYNFKKYLCVFFCLSLKHLCHSMAIYPFYEQTFRGYWTMALPFSNLVVL